MSRIGRIELGLSLADHVGNIVAGVPGLPETAQQQSGLNVVWWRPDIHHLRGWSNQINSEAINAGVTKITPASIHMAYAEKVVPVPVDRVSS